MAMTIYEASKLNPGTVVRDAVVETFARSNEVVRILPFENMTGGAYRYTVEGALPGIGFRGINQAFEESVGIFVPQIEALRIGGGDLDFDRAILAFQGEEVRSRHVLGKVKALALAIGKCVIKGDSVADVNQFDGLQVRIVGSQLIEAGTTSGGDALKLSKLDELIDSVDEPTHLVMSKAMRRRLTQAARDTDVGGFITYDKDEFGRKVTLYDGLPIVIPDHDEAGQRILTFDEVGAGGGTAQCTSIYCLSLSDDKMFGIQNGPMDVRELGELDAKPVERTRVEWFVGMVTAHPRCAARLRGIKDAAIEA